MENKVIISLDNIIHNYNVVKNKVGNIDIAPTLKADAYGAGAIEVAGVLLKNGCKNFFVFSTQEGLELRQKYKNKIANIYILCPKADKNLLKNNNLTPIVETFQQLQNFIDMDFGLFFNTGMNRNGFNICDIDKIKDILGSKKPQLILTHMGCPEDFNHPMSIVQINNFNEIAKHFPEKNILKSMFAVDGTMNCNKNYYDIVRPGIAVVEKEINKDFKDVITIKSYIKSINGNTAKIPFGINNGLSETYAKNGGYFIINGKSYYIEKINYNYSILRIDNNVKIGDEVIIADDSFSIKNITDKTKFNNSSILRREAVFRFATSKKNKQYYLLNNKTIKRKVRRKTYKNVNILNKKDRIETSIFDIINVQENGFVGYGATAPVKKGDVLATLYGGYCDGISRYLSNTGYFYINNVKCKIVGRVSMDQTTVLLDNKIKNTAKIGDKAYILKSEAVKQLNNLKESDIFYCAEHSRRVKKIF